MAIVLDNSTDAVDFGDVKIRRKNSSTIEIPSDIEVQGIKVTESGITFPDSSVQTTASSGGGGSSVYVPPIFNPINRYAMVSTSLQQVWATSSSTVKTNKTWSRDGTVLTLTSLNHGHQVGERVIIYQSNEEYQVRLIESVTTNSFTVTCADIGETSGTQAGYALGFTYAHNSSVPGSIANGTMSAPVGGDVRLLSLRMMLGANTRTTTNYIINFPASAINGIGQNTALEDSYIPIQSVRQMVAAMTAVAATLTTFHNGSYASYQIAALPAVATGILVTLNF